MSWARTRPDETTGAPDWDAVKKILTDELERSPGTRSSFLDTACHGDAALRAEVESLLGVHETKGARAEGKDSDQRWQQRHAVDECEEDAKGRDLAQTHDCREIGRQERCQTCRGSKPCHENR